MIARLFLMAVTALAFQGCATLDNGGASRCDGSAEANRMVVLNFYNEGLVKRRPEAAFMRYMTPDFVEHKPDVPDGTREATTAFLSQLMSDLPGARWEIVRTIADEDMVFLHARFTPDAGNAPYAVADIFKVKDCRIVEHWDVVAAPPNEQRNPNSRF